METKSPDGMPTVTFSYDLAGRLKKASTAVVAGNPASGDWEFEFDTAGRLITEISPDAKEVAYEPDENGNITKVTYPDSYYVERFYDEMNRLTDIKLNGDTDPAAHFTYDSLSRRLSIEYDNGTEIGYDYEWNDDMSSIEHLFDGSSVEFTYGFNDAHQVESQTVSDAQHMWHPSTTGTTTYTTANEVNQYPAVGGKDFTYNRNGCLTSDGDMLFNYDTENHLTTAIRCDGMSTYVYDPMHRQIQKKVGCSSKTRFVYSGWQRLADYDGEDTLQNRYVYGTKLDEPLIQVSGTGELSYFHHDRLGSIIAITDDTGAVLNRYAYSPWGECDDMSGTTFGFTGQRYDAESGLVYFKSRHYSNRVCRFVQPDPIGYRGTGLNLYAYVENDPLNFVDELGLSGWLTINTISTGNLGLGTHSWIGYQPDGEKLHTYGTYAEDRARERGYHQGMIPETDRNRTPDRTRRVRLSNADEVVLKDLLIEISARGPAAWEVTNPCSGFASEVWERMTHEKLDKKQIVLGRRVITPKSLGDAIFEANGNRAEGTLYWSPPPFSPANFVLGESD